jgi:hypothetical protein
MKNPSTGNAEGSSDDELNESGDDHPGGPSHTRTRMAGELSPRMPHERDESSDSGTGVADERIRSAHDDAESNRKPTDRSEATNAAYEGLRGQVPGNERDTPD